MLAIVGKFLSCSVDVGFILALPLHHGDLDSIGISTKDHVAICEIKIPVQELRLKM